jgi:hypothetical protein
MVRPTSIVTGPAFRKSHCTNLYNNFGQRALQVSEAIILVRTVNVYPQTIFLRDDDDRLDTTSQFRLIRKTISLLLLA